MNHINTTSPEDFKNNKAIETSTLDTELEGVLLSAGNILDKDLQLEVSEKEQDFKVRLGRFKKLVWEKVDESWFDYNKFTYEDKLRISDSDYEKILEKTLILDKDLNNEYKKILWSFKWNKLMEIWKRNIEKNILDELVYSNAYILKRLPETEFEFSNIRDDDIDKIKKLLSKQDKNKKFINLKWYFWWSDRVNELIQIIKYFREYAKSISLHNIKLSWHETSEIISVFKVFPKWLKSLNLDQNDLWSLSFEDLQNIFSLIPKELVSLNLCYNELRDPKELADLLSILPKSIKVLDLWINHLFEHSVDDIIKIFKALPDWLKFLDICNNKACDKNLGELIAIFSELPKWLKLLDLTLNDLKEETLVILEEKFPDIVLWDKYRQTN
jgi:hypothetical protein